MFQGGTYEEEALKLWLSNHNTSPLTNKQLTNRSYAPNRALKSLIGDFSREQSSRAFTENFSAFRICVGKHHRDDWKQRPMIKIVLSLLGASGVGKTVLAQCLQYGRLPENMKYPPPTIGVDVQFYYLDRLFQNEYVVVIQLNDPAGQKQFEPAINYFFRECHGALLLADTTYMSTLERLEQYWYKKLETLALNKAQSVLVCTKMDLFETKNPDYRDSFLQKAENFVFLHQMPMVQVSAYRGDNIEHIFKQLILRIMEDETLINDLLKKAIRPIDLINQRRDSLAASGMIPLGDSISLESPNTCSC
jgi:GTPase SAR1 family protein